MIQLKIRKLPWMNFDKNSVIELLVERKTAMKDLAFFLCCFLDIVAELTDDKSLDKAERKRLQIANANQLTSDAIIVRLADKIYNLRDLNLATPVGWSEERVKEYFEWSIKIARQLRGHNNQMDTILKDLFLQRNIHY